MSVPPSVHEYCRGRVRRAQVLVRRSFALKIGLATRGCGCEKSVGQPIAYKSLPARKQHRNTTAAGLVFSLASFQPGFSLFSPNCYLLSIVPVHYL